MSRKTLHSAVKNGTVIEVEEIHVHPKYFLKNYSKKDTAVEIVAYDIALLKLSKPIPSIPMIPLATKSIFDTFTCKVAGWGLRSKIVPIIGEKNDLQSIHINLMKRENCVKLIETIFTLIPEDFPQEKKDAALKDVVCGEGDTSVQTVLSGHNYSQKYIFKN